MKQNRSSLVALAALALAVGAIGVSGEETPGQAGEKVSFEGT